MNSGSEKITPCVAVIGAGYWGKNLIRNFHTIGALAMICETSESTRNSFIAQYPGAQVKPDLESALLDAGIKAICVATPAETHYDIVKKALNAGKHVFVEKPICLDVASGEELVALAAKKGRILMVGHLLQYHPAVVELKRLIRNGELGKLQYIYSNRLNLGKIRTEENILWSFAPHDISVMLSLAGQEPQSVSSFGSHFLNKSIADVTVSNFIFPSGVAAHIFVSWLHPFKEQKLVVVGDRKMVVLNDVEPQDKLLIYPHVINWKNGVPIPDKKEAEKVPYDTGEPLLEECKAFITAITTGKAPLTDGAEGLSVLRVLAACQESMRKGGKTVDLPKRETSQDVKRNYTVHPTAIVDEGCQVGQGTKIWHFSHVLNGSKIGKSCNIGQNVVIGPNITMGDGCKIQNNVSVYEGVTLEDGVFCGPSMVFTNVLNPRSHVVRKNEYKPTLVKTGVTIGANATIVCGTTLGRYSFIGAGAVVTRDVPDYALVVGNPSRRVGWMCECGVKLDFPSGGGECACKACGARFKLDDGVVSKTD